MFKRSKRRADNDISATQKNSLVKIIISLCVAVALWVGATSFESYLLSDKQMTEVLVANKMITSGTVLTEKTAEQYFTKMMVNSSLVTGSTVKDYKDIKGKTLIDIDKGIIASKKMFLDASYVNEKFEEPVEMTFSTMSIQNSVVGTIREGDLVDIIVTKKDEYSEGLVSEVVYSDVYIIATYDSSYVKLGNEDRSSQAVYFKIFIERAEETNFATLINEGNFTITKVK